jgi:hypothetical protein
MRTFIFALAAIVPASCAINRVRAADEPPTYDIARNCNAEIGTAGIGGVAPCTKDETDAKEELSKGWSQFDASAKKSCIEESGVGGEQSYVELLTCLEMSTGQFSPEQR